MKKLGVCIVGVHGAVASTVIAGVHMMVKGLAPRYGMVTEKTPAAISESIADWLDFAPLEDLVFGGWDLRFKNVYEGALHHKVFPADQLRPIKEQLEIDRGVARGHREERQGAGRQLRPRRRTSASRSTSSRRTSSSSKRSTASIRS